MLMPVSSTEHSRGWRPDDSSFGARLALVRHSCGWNVKEAALACGLPVQSWRNWETAGRRPQDFINVCGKIAERTGVDVAWLAGLAVGAAAHDELGHVGGLTRGDVAAESRCTPARANRTPLDRAAQAWGAVALIPGGRDEVAA